ncbi:hypothetical protein [Leucobacter triazinivorans]|uniref:Uncharacterized protein n=1 Tax=Leucobacter triazinivorans TaxID=1784719 RepID=A0A4P6KEP4_9MICO|nr:hypothetical protein [Leucobacter triazinivorans]QBE48742.1 hypothetical protein EVS81_07785 [Leucobacter triazinivorans]
MHWTRLALYSIATIAASIIAVLAYIADDLATMGVALGWITTNIIAGANVKIPAPDTQIGDHAAE